MDGWPEINNELSQFTEEDMNVELVLKEMADLGNLELVAVLKRAIRLAEQRNIKFELPPFSDAVIIKIDGQDRDSESRRIPVVPEKNLLGR